MGAFAKAPLLNLFWERLVGRNEALNWEKKETTSPGEKVRGKLSEK